MNMFFYVKVKNKKSSHWVTTLLNAMVVVSLLGVWSGDQALGSSDDSEKKESPRPVNVLSLDGGGARGVIELTILNELEKQAQLPIHRLFDVVAGSSVGGIIGAALTMPRSERADRAPFGAAEMLQEFEARLPSIFQPNPSSWNGLWGPKYQSVGLQAVMESFSRKVTFDQALTHLMIPAFDLEGNQAVIFKSWEPRSSCFYASDILRGTSAAPTLFEPHEMSSLPVVGISPVTYRLVDGGICMYSPAQSAMMEAEMIFGPSQEHLLVSLGAGEVRRSYPPQQFTKAGLITWASVVHQLFVDGQRSLSTSSMNRRYGNRYSYWSPDIALTDTSLDNFSPEILTHYKQVTLAMIDSRREEFNTLVGRLLQNVKPPADAA